MVAIKEISEKLRKTLVNIKQKLPIFVYKKYEDEDEIIIRKKLLDNGHKKVKTLEKYIGNVWNPKSFKNKVKDYNLNKKKRKTR